ncbi:MAG: sulfite exporter TauE/SafE family protein [Kofleriaceae bacterium]|jgi:uncharacterized membrane protein YfcA|nr:sulfite exporter TauE/SafE family protein [Kofleriaceae bacterium]MBP9171916.1 sulfite exporter TauE/SafE family protein [Kofleriaceae bacterium]MBP9859290.1 sulfite exporter TauE/SafE family protein [Kofleriaceae bacterium]
MLVLVLSLSLLIGISLGLLGGGGSILTLPILTYVAGVETKSAIASSLFVVAVTSGFGVISHARAGRVQWRTGILFGLAGMAGAYLGGRLAKLIPGGVLMVLFAAMMVATAIAMLRGRKSGGPPRVGELPIGKVLLEGVIVGVVTGIVGAGGGFLVVPALVLLGGLAMERAVATSLVVISMKSFAGFYGHLQHVEIDWNTTLYVTGMAIVGSLVGGQLAGKIPPATLRRAFGWFVLVMAVVVLSKELL